MTTMVKPSVPSGTSKVIGLFVFFVLRTTSSRLVDTGVPPVPALSPPLPLAAIPPAPEATLDASAPPAPPVPPVSAVEPVSPPVDEVVG